MVKKILLISLALIILLPLYSPVFAKGKRLIVLLTPTPTPTPTMTPEYNFASMTTYELFWPVVAGKVPGDRFYSLKLWRDKLISYLFFSNLKKSEFLKQQANKRLVEAEKLLEIQRYAYLSETLKVSGDNLEKGLVLLFASPETQSQWWLRGEYAKDLQKHLAVLERMKEKTKEEQKNEIEPSIEHIKGLIAKYSLKIEE